MKRILGYTDKLTVRPGEEIEFKVSAEEGTAYRAQLVRLVNGDTLSAVAGFKEIEISASINGTYRARNQRIVPGSCIVIEQTRPLVALEAWTLTLAFMPTTPHAGVQHLISHWDPKIKAGWSLQVSSDGRLAFTISDRLGRIYSVQFGHALMAKQWYRTAVRVNWTERTLTLDCIPVAGSHTESVGLGARQAAEINGQPPQVAASLLIAAQFGGLMGSGHCIPINSFNGRIEAPVIYRRCLTDIELATVMAGERPGSLGPDLVADWDFSLDIGSTMIRDRSPNALHGRTHNLPLRAVRGICWNGTEMNWRHAPEQYGAIHFHTDDLYDCGWQTDIRYTVPTDLRSGVYALRLRLKDEAARSVEDGHEEYLPFFVAAPKGRAQNKLAFLVPTYSYLAYGNVRGQSEAKRQGLGQSKEEYYAESNWVGNGDYMVVLHEHPQLGSSTYDFHLDGSPVHTSSWLRPLLNLRPKSVLWTFCADLLITDWLEARGFDYDVITDDLLQAEGVSLLKEYQIVITGNHPEYQTTQQLDALEAYLGQGGRLMYLGGNGFYWRCAVQACAPGVIEMRRGRTGGRMWTSEVGESYQAFSAELGGIWSEIGRPAQKLVGVGTIAYYLGKGHDNAQLRVVPEARNSRAAFILEGIEDGIVGERGIFGPAAGVEIDKTNANHGTPAHAIVVARSEGHGPDMLYVIEEMSPIVPVMAQHRAQTCAEVVFFETPQGGAVFSVGSMAWCGSLSHNGYDNPISTMTANALKRLLDPAPFLVGAGSLHQRP